MQQAGAKGLRASARGAAAYGCSGIRSSSSHEAARRAPPSVTVEAASALVAKWLDAQKRQSFGDYEGLYAERFHGIKRAGVVTTSFDQKGWLRDQKPMLTGPFRVGLEKLSVRTVEDTAVAEFIQILQSQHYANRGRKQLVMVASVDPRHVPRGGLHLQQCDAICCEAGLLVRMTKEKRRWVAVLLFGYGAVAVCLGGWILFEQARFEHSTVCVEARVIRQLNRTAFDKWHHPYEQSVDVYEFQVSSGESVQLEEVLYSLHAHTPLGERTQVCYPPGAPERAMLTGSSTASGFGALAFGAMCCSFGAMRLRASRITPVHGSLRNRRKAERRRQAARETR